ncbi:hypothetical protein [Sphingomonas qomolangmaensis]|uniref:Type II secretion system protein GspC N-terminal domain-containing protein n=1 Tax=Sphingomonas qomolangmaensis TaxID=2918765 RepID=A0ABY5LGT4_9SPHN|nr:hypothetical protein [Sphingomonas qomolangmaensis]UUL83941.1 hypothetical protein NMP03_07045 [Sphingomonas qomolangmaensis]
MALTREQIGWSAALALLAIATPAVVLLAPSPEPLRALSSPSQTTLAARPPLDAALGRSLFGAVTEARATPADAPALVGIAGRLNVDAVAMVRTSEGASRTLAVGEAVDGWQLRALAIDAAFFTRGTQEARVPMPGSAE